MSYQSSVTFVTIFNLLLILIDAKDSKTNYADAIFSFKTIALRKTL